eukprot:363337-Chlamydomonas_euryale.AAC.12
MQTEVRAGRHARWRPVAAFATEDAEHVTQGIVLHVDLEGGPHGAKLHKHLVKNAGPCVSRPWTCCCHCRSRCITSRKSASLGNAMPAYIRCLLRESSFIMCTRLA